MLLKRRCNEGSFWRPLLVVISIAFVVPCVAPFATGVGASSSTPSPRNPHNAAATQSQQQHHYLAARSMASTDSPSVLQQEGNRKRLSIRQFMSFLKGKDTQQSPRWKGGEDAASLPSRLLFRYASPLLDLAGKRRLEVDDAFEVCDGHRMNTTVSSLANIYGTLREKSRRKIEKQRQAGVDKVKSSQSLILTQALFQHQRSMLLRTGLMRLLNTCVQAYPAVLLARLLRLLEAGDANHPSAAFGAAVNLVAVLLVKMVIENQYFHYVVRCAAEVRGSLSGLIFDKSLRLPGGGSSVTHKTGRKNGKKRAELGTGGVLNLMQSDSSIIEGTVMQIHTLWDAPLQIAIYTTLLFRYLGPSVLFGIAVLVMTIPLNSFTLRILNRLAKYENEAKDARTKRTSESITNMKLLKLQGWEGHFADDIRNHRADELKRHSNRGVVRALNQAISNSVPALVLVVTLTAYVKTGQPIIASTIFTAISLFNQLRFPLFFYPMLIDSLANGRNAMRRISSYLSSEEIVPYVEHLPVKENGGSIEVVNGNFLWSTSKPVKDGEVAAPTNAAIYNANLQVNPGEIVAVVGSVGSGKSALVKALLGELVPVPRALVQSSVATLLKDTHNANNDDSSEVLDKPTVRSYGNVAYCSQEAWLPKGTIRDAVVFGREYDEERYLAAIRDAGLDEDIVDNLGGASSKAAAASGVLSHDTDVGEGGSSLSGGQRARVALARALYAAEDTKVFLLDDCLAALDARVGSTVFERIKRRLQSSGAATVMVTNDPNLPRRCDRVVLMQKVPSSSSCSYIEDVGTYDELIARGHSLPSVSSEDLEDTDDETFDDMEDEETEDSLAGVQIDPPKIISRNGRTIQIVDGYEMACNSTTLHCHADPECSAMALEKCPEMIAEKGLSMRMNEDDEDAEDGLDEETQQQDKQQNSSETSSSSGKTAEANRLQPNERKVAASADDKMSSGAVPRSAYLTYFKSVRKPMLVVAMFAAYGMSNGAQFFQQYIVAKWTEVGRGDSMAAAMGTKYLGMLVNAAGVVSASLFLRSIFLMRVGVRASEFLHSRLLSSVFRAPMSFFDATPSGQLLSRFGKETETIDRGIPDSFSSVLFCFLQIFMSVAALASVVTPGMVLPLAVVGALYVKTMGRFRPGARELKRLETKTRSPIYTHFGEALRGTETIRSIPGGGLFWSSTHRNFTDTNLRSFYSVKALDRWLSCRLETLGNTVVFTAAIASVWLTRLGRLNTGNAAWGLTQSLTITGLLTWAVRCLTDLETNMMSLVRVKELTDIESEEIDLKGANQGKRSKMPRENLRAGEGLESLLHSSINAPNITSAPTTDEGLKGWPWQGDIRMHNVSMRYNELSSLVLKGITLDIPRGTTLGVVGRSGSGKSSLLLTLFRLVEIEGGGKIEIDGVDIRSVSLQKLRGGKVLAVIAQDPVLFAGSVAYNLDATGKASEEDMWNALEAASPSLAKQFRSDNGLETTITEGGKNLSQGQRQLLCLARALLRRSRILVLDEATASVDPQTDQEVQETIRREFVDKGISVITVAHRLETVLGYDKIAVLGDGELVEYGTPKELLQIRNGELRRLVDADRLSQHKGSAKKSSEAIMV
ncbi:Multiple drug resistance-associated protein-like transporter 1 [Seminavis robusta]|uniref:Multiple drug resistance-associated protein-like transporter 1 n=1 Tax=Seminavis robusta TaxID=568900 RepID=A0A9N8H4Y4_9STRA|nr:Multiple drug resistance-associated protein-like transporter 1 [Seminavis robusta]|eukprot:Sro61_g035030.1 Multiple drug resistance-associated protein-like transporter 1 (1601) ;mRNA; f:69563-74630